MRILILQESSRVNTILKRNLPATEQFPLLGEFLRASRHLDTEVVGRIRQALTQVSG